MRQVFIILVLVVAGYFGWDYYQGHKDTISIPFLSKSGDAPGAATSRDASEAAPEAKFRSKIKMPDAPAGAKPMAPAGHYYMMDRVSVETKSGVIAVVPGDLVKLIERKGNGVLRVTNDQADFDVKEQQVTQDPEAALVAEKLDFEKTPHRRR